MRDPRSDAFVKGFAASWLHLDKLNTSAASGLDGKLQQAMREETERLVALILREDRSVLEFLDADYTFVNGALARHYGMNDVRDDTWQRVSLQGTHRGGLVTQAAILTLTSPQAQTSPTLRGKWLLENLLGSPPRVPPNGLLAAVAENRRNLGAGTARQLLESHRANPACAQCHEKMDALGFALENFDAVGAWRTVEGSWPINAAVILPTGDAIHQPEQVGAYLRSQSASFLRCLNDKLLIYALGRKGDGRARPEADISAKGDSRFSSVLLEVIASGEFVGSAMTESPVALTKARFTKKWRRSQAQNWPGGGGTLFKAPS